MGRNGDSKQILIFDSGVGGLSVYQEIINLMPNLSIVYAFDNEGFPYGELEPKTLIKRVSAYSKQIATKYKLDAIVIACNSASTLVLPQLRQQFDIPIVGVVPALKPASKLAKNGILLLATPATIKREYTHQLIKKHVEKVPVTLVGSTRLVEMAEQKIRGKRVDEKELKDIFFAVDSCYDVMVLGCTHFPLLKPEITNIVGEEVLLVDSGNAIARRVQYLLDIQGDMSGLQENNKHHIMSSAPAYEEGALNEFLEELNFNPVQHFPMDA